MSGEIDDLSVLVDTYLQGFGDAVDALETVSEELARKDPALEPGIEVVKSALVQTLLHDGLKEQIVGKVALAMAEDKAA